MMFIDDNEVEKMKTKNAQKYDKIQIIQKKKKNQTSSFFYDGEIAFTEKYNGTRLKLIACGDIRIYRKDGELVHDGKSRNSGIEINTDKDLKKVGDNYTDEYRWENNNWFEVLFMKKRTFGWDSTLGDVAYDYDEAIELLQSYIDSEEM